MEKGADFDLNAEALEQELKHLAHQKEGFERPEAVAAKLNLLLSLDSVVAASGSSGDSRHGRVFGLRSVLEVVITRLPNSSTQAAARIYFFLDEGQEHEEDLRLVKLEDRRSAIEDRLGFGHDTYRKGEEQRIRALVAGELLRHEEAARRDPSIGGADTPQLAERPGETLPTAQALGSILAARYRPSQDVSQLTALVIPDRPVYYDTQIEIALIDAEDPGRYRYQLKLTFTASIREYVVGVVAEPALCDVLLSSSDGITDVYSCSSERDRDERAEVLTKSPDAVRVLFQDKGGQTRQRALRLAPVEGAETAAYLGDWGKPHADRVRLLRTEVPTRPDGLARLIVLQEFELSKEDHFCYWVADRPIYVRSMSVDLHQFQPLDAAKRGRITVHPFMMAGVADPVSAPASLYSLAVENWLVRGQGVTIVW